MAQTWKILLAVALLAVCSSMAAAQGDLSCIAELAPCMNYLNATTKPPATCCLALLSVIDTKLTCLCTLLSPEVAKTLPIPNNTTSALLLPGLCGSKVTPANCLNANTTAPSPSKLPPATAGSSPSPPQNGAATSNNVYGMSYFVVIGFGMLALIV